MGEAVRAAPPPIAEPKPSPKPQPLDIRAEHKAELPHMLARERRIKTFESILGVSKSGKEGAGQVIRNAVVQRIATPIDPKFSLSPQDQRMFLDLHDAQAEIQRIWEENQRQPKDRADFAKLLATQLAPVYRGRPGGYEELRELTDDQVIKETFDFPGTVTRELVLREYLNELAQEQNSRRETASIVLNTAWDAPLPKAELKRSIKNISKYRTKAIRKLGTTAGRLRLTMDESNAVLNTTLYEAPAIVDFPQPLPPEKHQANAVEWQHRLIKQSIRNITGDTQESALDIADPGQSVEGTKHQEAFGKVRDRAEVYEATAKTIMEIQAARQKLAEVAQEIPGEPLKAAFKEYRNAERKLGVMKKAIGAVEKSIRGKFRIIAIRKQGIDRVYETNNNLIADSVRQFGKEAVTVAADGPVTPDIEELVALAQGQNRASQKGLDRVGVWADNRSNGHVDAIVELGKITPEDVELQDGRVVRKEQVAAAVKKDGEDAEGVSAQEAKAAAAKIEAVEQTPDTATQIQQEMETRVADDPKLVEKIGEIVQGVTAEKAQPVTSAEKISEASSDPLRLVVVKSETESEPAKIPEQPETTEEERKQANLQYYYMFAQAWNAGLEAAKSKKGDPMAEEMLAVEEPLKHYLGAHQQEASEHGIEASLLPLYTGYSLKGKDGSSHSLDHTHFDAIANALDQMAHYGDLSPEEQNEYGFYRDYLRDINGFMRGKIAQQAEDMPELKAA